MHECTGWPSTKTRSAMHTETDWQRTEVTTRWRSDNWQNHKDKRIIYIAKKYKPLYPISWVYQRHRQCNICHTALQKNVKFKDPGNILLPRAIYCSSRWYIARVSNILPGGVIYCPGAKYWPNSFELGQICPQYGSDCRATILPVGWLPYRKVYTFLMRILYRQQGSKKRWDFVND